MIIGIFGGGQLGMMMAEEAIKLGHKIIGLDPNPKCPLSHIADELIVAEYNDMVAFKQLVEASDVITYEFENVNLKLVEQYVDKIPQKKEALLKSRNRLVEKEYASSLGIATPRFQKFTDLTSLELPVVLKTTEGGYDGKGQYYLRENSDIDHLKLFSEFEYIVEEFLDFDYEISVVATRDLDDNVVTYPIPKNTHKNGILHISEIYNQHDPKIVKKAISYTKKLITELDYIGTLAVEYFVKGKDVIFNEFAPRPHNSGHYTIEGCNVSQFKNHILAITGEKVVNPVLIKPTIMVNVLGQDMAFIDNSKGLAETHIHMYNKDTAKENRKMGHITTLSDTIEDVIVKLRSITKESL